MTCGLHKYGSAAVLILALFLHSTDAWSSTLFARPKNDTDQSSTAAVVQTDQSSTAAAVQTDQSSTAAAVQTDQSSTTAEVQTAAPVILGDDISTTTVKSTTPYVIADNFVATIIKWKMAELPWPLSKIVDSMKRTKRDVSATSTSPYSNVFKVMNNIFIKNENNLTHLKQLSLTHTDYRPLVESLENEIAEDKAVWNALNLELLKPDEEQNKEIPALVQKLHEIIIKDTVKSILSNDILHAEQQLKLLDDATCEKIVLKVYKEQGNQGLEFVLSVAARVRGIATKIKVYEGLYNTMKNNDEADARKLLRVFRTVMKEIHKTKGPIDPKTRSLIFDLWNDIQESGDESIYFAFLHED